VTPRLAARLVIEEALEGEAAHALDRGYYARGAQPGFCRTQKLDASIELSR
jgi:hypothetical protein